MDYNAQLKLQAFLDGELPEAEAGEVSSSLKQDRKAAALLEELRNTRRALAGFEAETKLPESREFFWSKIRREIQRQERAASRPAPAPLMALLRRFVVSASAVALVVIAGLLLTRPPGPAGTASGPEVETALADAGAFTYRDYDAGTTLVWLSYPADNEVADNDEMGTVD